MHSRILEDAELIMDIGLTAKLLSEIEDQRIRNVNRREVLLRPRSKADADGGHRGFGLPKDHKSVAMLDAHLRAIATQEAGMTKLLEAKVKQHPLSAWIKAQRGLGYKQLGRLLAVIQDPSWHTDEHRPRRLAELYAYCGMTPDCRRARGVPAAKAPAQWSTEAKMRLHLVAAKAMTQLDRACKIFEEDGTTYAVQHVEDCRCGHYRLVYEARRAFTAGKVHTVSCVRCGPSGSPAQPGSPWPPAHQHADAVGYVGKRILHDLFDEARRINGFPDEKPMAA